MTAPSRERSFRTPAIILKRRDFGEADRLLTLLTPGHGKFDALAKGARKLTSTKLGHVELYTRADMLIHRGRDLAIVSQAEMIAPYLPLREDLMRGAYAGYCVEFLDRLTAEDDVDSQRLFILLDDTLVRLCLDSDMQLAVRFYEMRLLDVVGYRPELLQCAIGHEPLLPEDQFFSNGEGGVVCVSHAPRSASLVPLPVDTLKLLRHLQRSTWKQVAGLRVPAHVHADAERIMLGYISYVIERKLQSVDFIRRIQSS
jgi:DNA repair protein RecO (recombination protein O)